MEYKLEQSLLGHQKGVRCITHVTDPIDTSVKFASGGEMGEVIVWKITDISFEPFIQFEPHINTVMCITSAFDKFTNSTVVYSGGRDTVIVKSSIHGNTLLKYTGHIGPVCSISLVAEKGLLLSGSWDGTAIIWNLESTAVKYKIDGFQYGVYPSFCLTNGYVYLGSQNGHITVWNGIERVDIDNTLHKDAVRTVRIYNQTILTSSNDTTVKTFNLKFSEKKEFCGHTSFVYDAHITSDGASVISASEDFTVIVWDIQSGKSVQVIPHPSTVWQTSSFGNRLVTACQDGRVRIYNKDPEFTPDPALTSFDTNVDDISTVTNTAASSNNTYYAGDSQFPAGNYDYIFKVEQNGKYYSLPYNRGDDPRSVAEKFCKNTMISINNVGTITDFIIKNVPHARIETPIISVPLPINFPNVSKDKLLDKITEFNKLVSGEIKLTLIELDSIKQCLYEDKTLDTYILSKLYLWPKQQLLPILDLLRILPLKLDFNITVDYVKLLIQVIESCESEIFVSLALKTIANSLYLTVSKMKMENYMPQICNILLETAKNATLRIQQPLSVIALNYSHILISRRHSEQRRHLLKLIVECLRTCKSHIDNWGLSVSNRFIMALYKLQLVEPKILSGSNDVGELLLNISKLQPQSSLPNDVKEALAAVTSSIYN